MSVRSYYAKPDAVLEDKGMRTEMCGFDTTSIPPVPGA